MINSIERTDVMAVEDDLPLEFVPIALDLVVLDHDDYQVNVSEECVEVVVLVRDHILLDEGVVDLQRLGEVALLTFK